MMSGSSIVQHCPCVCVCVQCVCMTHTDKERKGEKEREITQEVPWLSRLALEPFGASDLLLLWLLLGSSDYGVQNLSESSSSLQYFLDGRPFLHSSFLPPVHLVLTLHDLTFTWCPGPGSLLVLGQGSCWFPFLRDGVMGETVGKQQRAPERAGLNCLSGAQDGAAGSSQPASAACICHQFTGRV